MRSLILIAAAFAVSATPGVARGGPAGEPAFENGSFEQPGLAGWSKLLLFKQVPLPLSARVCLRRPAATRSGPRTALAADAPIPAKPSLGGDYWNVPVEVSPTLDRDGRCALSMKEKDHLALISPTFTPKAGQRWLSFLAQGSSVSVTVQSGDGKRTLQAVNRIAVPDTGMRRVAIDLSRNRPPSRGPMRLLIVRRPGREVLLDDFRLSENEPEGGNAGGLARLYGFADLHTHFFTQMGLGGRLFWGRIHSSMGPRGLDGPRTRSRIQDALGRCHPSHGQHGEGVTTLVPEQGHNASGWPDFKGWPNFGTKSHQQMYVDWLRRAWEGGLRLVHMDVLNNPILPKLYELTSVTLSGNKNPNEYWRDDWSIREQVKAAYDFASLPDVQEFLAIARSPEEARRIIASGKLAVVLGVEVEDPGDFTKDPGFQRLAARVARGDAAAIREVRTTLARFFQKLRDDGVRHFFPVHINDNVFGGAALYELMLDAGNWLMTRQLNANGVPNIVERFTPADNLFSAGVRVRLDHAYRSKLELVRAVLTGADLVRHAPVIMGIAGPLVVGLSAPLLVGLSGVLDGLLPGLGTFVMGLISGAGTTAAAAAAALWPSLAAIATIIKTLDARLGISTALAKRVAELEALARGRERTVAHGNRYGLSAVGRIFVEEAMRAGMIIDISHMGEKTAHEVLTMAETYDYPVISSHTGFRDLSFGVYRGRRHQLGYLVDVRSKTTEIDTRDGHRLAAAVGSGDPEHFARERDLSLSQARRIQVLGGMIGIGTGAVVTPVSWPLARTNSMAADDLPDCDGSTKAWVQVYRYALEALGELGGLALGTDANGLAGGLVPRFGTHACTAMQGDDTRKELAKRQALVQKNGVRYATPIQSIFQERFAGPMQLDAPFAAWIGIARFVAGQAPKDRPFGCDIGNRGLERDAGRIAWGFGVAARGEPRPPNHCGPLEGLGLGTDTNADGKAAWDTYHDRPPREWHDRDLTLKVQTVWRRFQAMQGNNPPMRRSVTGNRDFDFNLDGLAHYGMLPDMLQDAKNVGLTAKELGKLFAGADHYVRMWEKIERRRDLRPRRR